MNIPENILQQVADEAFESSDGGTMGLLTCIKTNNNLVWHNERYARRAVIQHALDNPALAPFLPAAEATPPAEFAAQVPLGPEDMKPNAWFKLLDGSIQPLEFATPFGVVIKGQREMYTFGYLKDSGVKMNESIPDTGRWDANAWRPCSKPAGKEVSK